MLQTWPRCSCDSAGPSSFLYSRWLWCWPTFGRGRAPSRSCRSFLAGTQPRTTWKSELSIPISASSSSTRSTPLSRPASPFGSRAPSCCSPTTKSTRWPLGTGLFFFIITQQENRVMAGGGGNERYLPDGLFFGNWKIKSKFYLWASMKKTLQIASRLQSVFQLNFNSIR